MRFDLKKERIRCGMNRERAAIAAGLTKESYSGYEEKGEIPCKYAYKIWKNEPSFKLPDDFFYFTSFSLKCNMHYYGLTQKDIAKAFAIPSQSNVSMMMQENVPMYEYKEDFLRLFDPLVVPCRTEADGRLVPITELSPKGNFMARKKRQTGTKPARENTTIKYIHEEE